MSRFFYPNNYFLKGCGNWIFDLIAVTWVCVCVQFWCILAYSGRFKIKWNKKWFNIIRPWVPKNRNEIIWISSILPLTFFSVCFFNNLTILDAYGIRVYLDLFKYTSRYQIKSWSLEWIVEWKENSERQNVFNSNQRKKKITIWRNCFNLLPSLKSNLDKSYWGLVMCELPPPSNVVPNEWWVWLGA